MGTGRSGAAPRFSRESETVPQSLIVTLPVISRAAAAGKAAAGTRRDDEQGGGADVLRRKWNPGAPAGRGGADAESRPRALRPSRVTRAQVSQVARCRKEKPPEPRGLGGAPRTSTHVRAAALPRVGTSQARAVGRATPAGDPPGCCSTPVAAGAGDTGPAPPGPGGVGERPGRGFSGPWPLSLARLARQPGELDPCSSQPGAQVQGGRGGGGLSGLRWTVLRPLRPPAAHAWGRVHSAPG